MNVVFADSNLQSLTSKEGALDIYAYVYTNEASISYPTRAQDGFGKGDFIIELSIKSKEGGYCKSKFKIHVERNHSELTMKKLTILDKVKIFLKRSVL